MKTCIIILVDQLAWQDRIHMPNLSKMLGTPQMLQVPYYPTVTETAHASIATDRLQIHHGIIGSEWFTLNKSIARHIISEKVYLLCKTADIGSRIEQFVSKNIQTFVIAGKEKVAQLLDPRPDKLGRGIRVHYERSAHGTGLVPRALPEDDKLNALLNGSKYLVKSIKDKSIDRKLMGISQELFEKDIRDPARDAFLFISLPFTDSCGHKYGHQSNKFINALKDLDKTICEFIGRCECDDRYDLNTIVLSDHGCREINTIIWPNKNETQAFVADNDGNRHMLDFPVDLLNEYIDDDGTKRPTLIFDGGTIRFWTKKGAIDRTKDFMLKSKFRFFIEHVLTRYDMNKYLKASYHPNFGDVVVLARKNVAFCKYKWIEKDISRKFPLPLGEHGTYFDEDRFIPCWGKFNKDKTVIANALNYFIKSDLV